MDNLWWVSNETLSNVYSLLINGKSALLSFYAMKHKHAFLIIFYDNTYKIMSRGKGGMVPDMTK